MSKEFNKTFQKDGADGIAVQEKEFKSLSEFVKSSRCFELQRVVVPTSRIKEFINKCIKRFRNINDGMAEMIIKEEAGDKLI